jgi:hypothetical protein
VKLEFMKLGQLVNLRPLRYFEKKRNMIGMVFLQMILKVI